MDDNPNDSGLSLESLNQAFAQMLSDGADPYDEAPPPEDMAMESALPAADLLPTDERDAGIEITPRTILEAMLFVGTPTAEPLSAERVAALMRGVRPAEIDELVRELNDEYTANNCPYFIRSIGVGYRMELRPEFAAVRERFQGRVRQAKLSTAAIEVLSIVAYRGPQTHDEIAQLRGAPSRQVLTQLVRRQLLAIERRAADKQRQSPRRTLYAVTPRFLQLFGLKNLEELPRNADIWSR